MNDRKCETIRAVFLAAIMALSMVAMVAAGFAGTAVAQDEPEPGDNEAILLDANGEQVGNDSYATIQAAVSDVETEDAVTVLVGSGTYEESVEINTDGLSFEGPNAGTPADESRNNEATINGTVEIDNASGVTVDGFKIAEGSSQLTSGVSIQPGSSGGDGITVTNSIIENMSAAGGGGTNDFSFGVLSFGGNLSDVTITDNRIANIGSPGGTQGVAVSLQSLTGTTAGTGATVERNTIRNISSLDSTRVGTGVALRSNLNGNDSAAVVANNSFAGLEIAVSHPIGDTADVNRSDLATVPVPNRPQRILTLTVQDAITAAESGATVEVGPGTFEESVTIGVEGLTLEGPNAGTPGDSDARGAEAVITGGSGNTPGVQIAADNVTLDGLQVENTDTNGIRFGPDTVPSNVTIQNSVVTNVTGSVGGKGAGNGIQFQFGSPVDQTAQNIQILDNEISNISSPDTSGETDAIGVNVLPRGNNVDLEIRENTFTDIVAGNDTSGSGVATARAISLDTQDDNKSGFGRVDGVVISNNTFDGITADDVRAVALFEDSRLDPREGVENFSITQNRFANLTLTANTTRAGPAAVFVGGYETLGTGVVTESNIESGAVFRTSDSQIPGFDPSAAEDLNAVENWWGNQSGPSGAGPGVGNPVSENVTFDPWLDAPFPAGQPVTDGDIDVRDYVADNETVAGGTLNASATVENGLQGATTNQGRALTVEHVLLANGNRIVLNSTSVDVVPGTTETVSFVNSSIPDSVSSDSGAEHRIEVRGESVSQNLVIEPTGSVAFNDQVLGTNASGSDAVLVEDVSTSDDATVVVTYENNAGDLVIAGLTEIQSNNLGSEDVTVAIEDTGGPGEHVAHLIPTSDLSTNYSAGDTVSNATADSILDSEAATVFDGSVNITDQQFEDATTEVTVDASDLQPAGASEYKIVVHNQTGVPAGGVGPPIGFSANLTGAETNVTIPLTETLDTTTDVLTMLHFPGDPTGPPIPTLNGTAFGISDAQAGTVTDTAEAGIFSAEGAELDFGSQALGVDEQGNAVVYVDNITEAEQVEQTDVTNPADDFVVLFEGEQQVASNVVDFAPIADAQNGELTLEAENTNLGTHTVEIFADVASEFDPTDVAGGSQSTQTGGSQSAQVADQLAEASGETTVILLVERNIERSLITSGEVSSAELQRDSELTMQPVKSQINQLATAEIQREYWVGNAMSVEIDLDQSDLSALTGIPGVSSVVPNVQLELPPQPTLETGAGSDELGTDGITPGLEPGNFTYGLQKIGIPSFEQQFETDGEGATVAIIDDGISNPDAGHPDLDIAQRAIAVNGSITEGTLGSPGAHGEHVAGTATGAADPAGEVPRYGVAPNASLIKINAFEGGASLNDILAGVQYSVAQDADVAGMSLGFSPTNDRNPMINAVDRAMKDANAAGTLVSVSAGNSGNFDQGGPVTSPAPEFGAFSVGASFDNPVNVPEIPASIIPSNTGSNNDIVSFSSGGVISERTAVESFEYPDTYPRQYVQPDVSAPGTIVISAGPLGSTPPSLSDDAATYSYSSGTSMAQPHVAGAVALVQSVTSEDLGPKQIEAALVETAEKPADASELFRSIGNRDIRYGTGIINVTAAALAAQTENLAVSGNVSTPDGSPVVGGTAESADGSLTNTDENGTFTLQTTAPDTSVTVDAFGFEPATVNVSASGATGDPVQISEDVQLDRDLAVELISVPRIAQDSFNITVDVGSLEEFTVELGDTADVSASEINVSLPGQELSLGETVEFSNLTGTVTLTVELTDDADLGDRIALDHTFAGAGDETTVTTSTFNTVPSLENPRGAAETANVLAADVAIDNQSFEGSTSEVTVSTSSVLPDDEEYVIVVHNNTEGLPILGNSGVLNGSQEDVTVTLDEQLDTTTDVVAMLHFADNGTFGAPITAFTPAAGAPTPVTDTATVEIQQAEGGNVEFQSQVLGTSDGSPAVLAENVTAVDVETVDNAFDPQDDFLVLTNGTGVTGPDNVIDAVQLSELNESADVTLNATGATPGQHTVVLHEPNDAGTGPDPSAPRTDASTGEVVNATATVFSGSVTIDDQTFEDNTTTVNATASDLQPSGEYVVVVHNQTGVPAGGVGQPIGFSDNLTGAQTNATVSLTEEITQTTPLLAMLHFPGNPAGTPIPTLNGTDFGIGDNQTGTVTDTATATIVEGQVTITQSPSSADRGDNLSGAVAVNVTASEVTGQNTAPITVELVFEGLAGESPTTLGTETVRLGAGESQTVTFDGLDPIPNATTASDGEPVTLRVDANRDSDSTTTDLSHSVQNAVDFAVFDGQSAVDLLAGTYPEEVTIDTDNATIAGAGTSVTTIDGNVTVTGDNNTLENFTIDGNLTLDGANNDASNVTVTGSTTSPQPVGTYQSPSGGNVFVNNDATLTDVEAATVQLSSGTTTISSSTTGTLELSQTANVDISDTAVETVEGDGRVVLEDAGGLTQGVFDEVGNGIDNASAGENVELLPGTFDESVTVDVTDLTVEGPNAGTPGDNNTRGSEATITQGVEINASGVTLDGLDVTNSDVNGIVITEAPSDVTVANTVVRDIAGGTAGASKGVGNGVNLQFNDVANQTSTGIEVTNNLITGVTTPGASGTDPDADAIGVQLLPRGNDVVDLRIANNTIENIEPGAASGGRSEARAVSIATQFTDTSGGTRGDLGQATNLTVADNDVSNLTADFARAVNLFEDKDGDTTTSDALGPVNFTVTGNTVTEINSTDGSLPDLAMFVGEYGNFGADHSVQRNNFLAGVENFGGSSDALNATENWWGNESGPAFDGPGVGPGFVIVDGEIEFDPWLNASVPGGQPVTDGVFAVENFQSAATSVQRGDTVSASVDVTNDLQAATNDRSAGDVPLEYVLINSSGGVEVIDSKTVEITPGTTETVSLSGTLSTASTVALDSETLTHRIRVATETSTAAGASLDVSHSISAAINAAESGETVTVRAGTYEESVTVGVQGLTVEPAAGASPTVVGQSSVAVSIESPDVTLSDLTIQNPQGDRGVRATDDATNVKIARNTIENVGTEGAFNQSRGILVSSLLNGDSASGLEIRNNTIDTVRGTGGNADQTIGIQILEESNGGGLIENVVVDGNTVTDLLDNRSSQGINFNGNIEGDITNNSISTLNTDRPGADLGFTQAIALNAGGNAGSAPQNVDISGNSISNLDDQTPSSESFRATHIILSSVDDVGTIDITNNEFTAVASDENYILDRASGDFDLQGALSANTFAPDAVQVTDGSDRVLVPETGVPVVNVDQNTGFEQIQPAVDGANAGDTIEAKAGTFNESQLSVNVPGLTIEGSGNTVIDNTAGGGATVRTIATDITITNLTVTNSGGGNGFDIPTTQNASGLQLDDVTISDTSIAFFNDLTTNGGPNDDVEQDFSNVVFSDVTIENSERKGIYTEALSDAIFDNVTIDGVTSDSYGFNSGIDINLKYDDYENITIRDSTVANVSEGDPFRNDPSFSATIAVKARDDPSSYDANPATLDDVTIDGVTIEDSFNGLRIGEPGVEYSAAPQGPTDVTITDSTFQDIDGYYVEDVPGELDLSAVLNEQGNTFDPDGEVVGDRIRVEGTAPADTVVNLDTSDTFTGTTAIQDAVDNANSDNTLRVGPGTFEESVTIDVEGLSIEGPNAGTPADESRNNEATINGTVEIVGASGVTVDGFKIAEGSSQLTSGVSIQPGSSGADGITVTNSIIENMSAAGGGGTGDFTFGVLSFGGNLSDVTITDNRIANIGSPGGTQGVAVSLQSLTGTTAGTGATVERNTIRNISSLDSTRVGTGVALRSNFNGNDSAAVVANNSFSNLGIAVSHPTGGTVDVDRSDLATVPVTNRDQRIFTLTVQDAITAAQPGVTVEVGPGTFEESVTIDVEGLTLEGAGNSASGTVLEASSSGSGNGITVDASDLTVRDLRITDYSNGIRMTNTHSNIVFENVDSVGNSNRGMELRNSADLTDLTLNNVDFSNNNRGIRGATTSSVDGLTITDSEFSNNVQGITIFQSESNPGQLNDVTISNTEFIDNNQKGIYTEKLSNATLNDITVDGITSNTYVVNNGIDINLKYDDYENITIRDSTVASVSEGDPLNGNPSASVAVAIKARGSSPDDTSYTSTPAVLDDVTIENVVIKDSFNGLRIGEFGTDYSGGGGPTNVDITDSTFQDIDGYYVEDVPGNLDLNAILNNQNNNFDPDGEVVGDQILVAGTAPGNTVVNLDSGATFTGTTAIQDAVDNADSDNTLRVGPGTFTESVTIDVEGLSIEGPNAGTPADESRSDEAIISGTVEIVGASGVTVDGFKIAEGSGQLTLGVSIQPGSSGGDGITVTNSIIENMSAAGGGGTGDFTFGVLSFGGNLSDVTITDNRIANIGNPGGTQGVAVSLQSLTGTTAGTGATVERNTIRNISSLNGMRVGTGVALRSNFNGNDSAAVVANNGFASLEIAVSHPQGDTATVDRTDLATVVVDDPGSMNQQRIFTPTVQDAVTAAESGDTVEAGPGTFEESVTIDVEGLTLAGAGADATTIVGDGENVGSRPHAAIHVDDGSGPVRNVTIEGFSVENPNGKFGIFAGTGTTNANNDGIGGLVIRDNVVQDVSTQSFGSALTGGPAGIAIRGDYGTDGNPGIEISDNEIDNVENLQGGPEPVGITLKSFTGNAGFGFDSTGASVTDAASPPATDTDILNNEISNISSNGGFATKGISVSGEFEDVDIIGNSLTGINGTTDGDARAITLSENGGSYDGNEYDIDGDGNGERIGPQDFDIRNNEISDVTGDARSINFGGYEVFGDHTVSQNTINDGAVTRFAGDQPGYQPGDGDALNASENTFTDSSADLYYSDATDAADLDAVFNDNDFSQVDVVVGSTAITRPPTGGEVLNVDQVASFNSIQTAVDSASAGNTIAVGSGTFTESVTVDVPSVTVESAASATPTVVGQSSVTVSIQSPGVTLSDLTIQNPQGDRGVRATDDATNVKIARNTIENVGTEGAFNQSRGILVSSLLNGDSASGLEIRNNTVDTVQATGGNADQTIGIQILEESNGGGLIENVVVDGNTVTDLLDNRSSQGINFNGNIEGDITNNSISTLNTDRPGADLGFTQAIALNAGGNAGSAPQNVDISGNSISNLDDQTPSSESFRATHIILSSVDDVGTIDITNNEFTAVASDENYILDRASGDFDLQGALSANTFAPDAVQVTDGSDRVLVPETFFDVDIDETQTDDSVEQGEEVTVVADIENTGEEEATQDVTLDFGAEEDVDSVEVENLDGGESQEVTLTHTVAEDADTEPTTAEVSSDDDSDSATVTVEEQEATDPADPADFSVSITDTPDSVTEGEEIDVSAAIENTGDDSDTQTITFEIDSEEIETTEVSLDGGSSETVEFSFTTDATDVGDVDITVASDDDSDSATVTVEEQEDDPADFSVSITDTPDSVTEGEEIDVSAAIENTGNESDTQTITFEIGGEEIETTEVSLDGGSSETVEFSFTTDATDVGDVDITVASDDDSDSATVTVEEAPAEAELSITTTDAPDEVSTGEDATAAVTVENVGNETAEQTVELRLDDAVVDTEDVELAGGDSETVDLTYTTDADDVPEIDLEVATADDSQTVTVDVVGDAEFALAIASALTDEEVVAGATAEVAVDIDNVGTAAGEETLTLFVDGEERATDTVSVDAGGFASAVFEIDTDEGDVGELDLSIEAEESGQTLETIIAVTEPPEEPVFELSILDVGDPVGAGESVTFEAEITNDGGLDGQQAVELVVRGVVRDTETVTLESGESQTVSLAFTPDADDAPSVDATVETADDTATAAVEVQRDGELAVSIADTTTPVVAGEQFTVEVEIENVGDTITEETVELRYDGDVVAETSIELDGGDTTTESFTVETAEDDEGTPIVEARSADDISVQSVSIGAAANLEVAVESVPDSVVAGEEATVEIGIENTGDAEGRQQVQADIGGERLISDRVTLDSGEETTLTAAVETDVDDVGELAVEASSADDAATAEFDVREPPAFELADASVDGPVLTNETLTAEITVENTGGTAGTETVDLFVGPTTVDTASVEVEPNETETVILSYDPEEADIGEIELAAVGSDGLVEASVTVAAPPEPGEFTVDTVSATDPVTAGEELTVRADVVNIGDLTTEETVTLEIKDVEQVVDETELTLDGGEEQRVTLSTELAADRDPGEVEVSLETASETATATVEVIEPPEDPLFRIDSLDVPSSVEEGNDIPVTVTVTNIGDLADTQTVAVTADDETGVEEEVTLGAGESEVIETTIENIQVAASEGLDDGESELEADEVEILESIIPLDTPIAVTATTDDGTETASVSVETPAPAAFEVDSVDTPAAVESGDTAAVTVDVENTGEESGTTIVTATLGPATESETVSVDGGETETVTVEVPVAAEARAGTFNRGLTVDIDGDSATASLAIDYGAIQSGLAEAETGETVLVADEEYRESVVVETAGVTLTAPDGATLKPRAGVGIELQAPDVTVEGMTIKPDEQTGVRVVAGAIEVADTEITGADVGINVIGGAETVVRGTAVSDVTTGILLDDAADASVAFSEVTDAATGIEIRSDDVTITSTAVTDNAEGISIRTAAGTDISESDISNNEIGVVIEGGDDHQVATSNIEQNEVNVLTQAAEAGAEPESNTASQTQQLEDTQVVIEEAWLGADPTEVPPEETIIDEADSVEIVDPSGTPYESAAFDLTAELPDTTVTFEPLTVEVTVNNTGGLAGRQTVTLAVDGDIVDTADVELEQGATTTVELTYVPETVDVGELPLTIDAGDESVTEAVVVDFEEELPEVDITTFADDDGIVRADGLTEAIDQFRADEIGIELLREVIDAFRSGEPVEFTVETYARFGEDPDVVEIDGLRAAIDDFREDNIGIDLLRSVIDAFRTGDPV